TPKTAVASRATSSERRSTRSANRRPAAERTGARGEARLGSPPSPPPGVRRQALCSVVRLDVLVEPEHVGRVVLALERQQPRVGVLAVGRASGIDITEEIDV